jgi:hypothetical protein
MTHFSLPPSLSVLTKELGSCAYEFDPVVGHLGRSCIIEGQQSRSDTLIVLIVEVLQEFAVLFSCIDLERK